MARVPRPINETAAAAVAEQAYAVLREVEGFDAQLGRGEALLRDLFDLLLHSRNWLSSLFDHGQRR